MQGQTVQKENEEPQFDPSEQSPENKIAHTQEDKIWDAHKVIGFMLFFLLLSRVFIEVSRNKEDRLRTRINNALAIKLSNKEYQQERWHYVLVKWGYVLFYGLLSIMATTGLILAFVDAAI